MTFMENTDGGVQENQGGKYISVIVFLFVILLVGGIYLLLNRGNSNKSLQTGVSSGTISNSEVVAGTASPSANSKMISVTELQIVDEKVGTGAEAVAGKNVSVNYTGTLTDGTVFDSNTIASFGHVEPFTFSLGAGQVIEGWDKGVVGMKVGGKRKLTIPSSMAYGDSGVPGAIPGGASLVFEVELLKVE